MTRAADRLIVGGCMPGNMNNVRKHSWYDLIEKGLGSSGLNEQTIETPDGAAKRYTRLEDVAAPAFAAATAVAATSPIELPPWLRTAAPSEASAERLLRPSDPADDESRRVRSGESTELRTRALRRGTLVHRLLQSLPDAAAERRRDAALGYLARNAEDWADAEREVLTESLLALIADGRFAPVFGAGSRAEVSIAGKLARRGEAPALISGQIDRLVVTPDQIMIIDYKANQTPPRPPAGAPRAYVRQLALYRALLVKIYPHLPVRAALLWTEIPELMEISASELDAELASIISA
jgi:ATP-dependent helicase/nuclease subunit A